MGFEQAKAKAVLRKANGDYGIEFDCVRCNNNGCPVCDTKGIFMGWETLRDVKGEQEIIRGATLIELLTKLIKSQ